ncbi:MG2 domain-containing protein [Hymenobacter chitinivorans]|nr:MG2 domain-containing protein [Hymenobacter chitinivorans]
MPLQSRYVLLSLCSLLLGLARPAAAQTDSLPGITGPLARYRAQHLTEKLFLHLDRHLYLTGETMWFKVYAVDGTRQRPLPMSTVAYVEVLDESRQPVLQGKVALQQATGQGSFQLPGTLPSGTYTVRAYTNWMKNFSPDFYFHSSVTIVNTFLASGAVPSQDSASYDVQFFPEGGNLVQGLTSRVGFKITDKSGRSVAAQGRVQDGTGRNVASFSTLKFGLGSFELTPAAAGNAYTATVVLPNKRVLTRRLPAVQEQGYVLRLDASSPDQLSVVVQARGGAGNGPVYLLAHARQQLAFSAGAPLTGGQAVFRLSRGTLPAGITHFTVFNAQSQPVAERLYFQAPEALTIQASADKPRYGTREKVSLQVATAAGSRPMPASLSMAVYRLDSLTAATPAGINGYLWLAADLKGVIENPDYYFAPGPEVALAADNLMLTQGWSRFRWDEVQTGHPPVLEFAPELNGQLVRGRILRNGSNQPAPGILAYLASPSRIVQLQAARSGPDGGVVFEVPSLTGLHDVVLQTNTQQDSTYHFELLDPYSARFAALPRRPFAAPVQRRAEFAQRHQQAQIQATYFRKFNSLYATRATDSTAFYGKADEQYRLDDFTRFKVMEEVLREYVPGVTVRLRKDGFHFIVTDRQRGVLLEESPLVLLDGVPVFNANRIMALDPLKVQKLEVVDSRFFQGPALYNGIVSFTTYGGDLAGFQPDAKALLQEYEGVQRQREFYAPRYDTPQARQSRLPDQRHLLYWNPAVTTTGGGSTPLEFYTGDQPGRYRVVVQGLSGAGQAGSQTITLEVKPAL